MGTFGLLPEDVIVDILQYLDSADRIAVAYTCSRIRNICLDQGVLRKVHLGMISNQKKVINNFLTDKQLTRYTTELNLSNHLALNLQVKISFINSLITCCPLVEALHIINSGVSFQSLHQILQRAPRLTTLSFSIMYLLQGDLNFIKNDMKSVEGICLANIKHLYLEIIPTSRNVKLLKHLVTARCKYLEELEILVWDLPCKHKPKLANIQSTSDYDQTSEVTESLEHLHSLTVEAVNGCDPVRYNLCYQSIFDFIVFFARSRPRNKSWKRFYVSPPLFDVFDHLKKHDFAGLGSIEAFSVNCRRDYRETKLNALLERISDGVVRKLKVHNIESFTQFCTPISRICGAALQSLSLRFIKGLRDVDLNSLFSACTNIKELDLIGCHFINNICEFLCKLRHLKKIQVPQCAIAPNQKKEQTNEPNLKFLAFVENCQYITEFHVRGCVEEDHEHFEESQPSWDIAEDDLLPIAKYSKLQSLTCFGIKFTNGQDTLLKEILEKCKCLTMLRISVERLDSMFQFTFLESARSLKHFVVFVDTVDFGSEVFWNLVRCATYLERLCIISMYKGTINATSVVEMVKSLRHLHVLHLHFGKIENLDNLYAQVMAALEEEKLERTIIFEFLIQQLGMHPCPCCGITNKKIHPLNMSELCYVSPRIGLPRIILKQTK